VTFFVVIAWIMLFIGMLELTILAFGILAAIVVAIFDKRNETIGTILIITLICGSVYSLWYVLHHLEITWVSP